MSHNSPHPVQSVGRIGIVSGQVKWTEGLAGEIRKAQQEVFEFGSWERLCAHSDSEPFDVLVIDAGACPSWCDRDRWSSLALPDRACPPDVIVIDDPSRAGQSTGDHIGGRVCHAKPDCDLADVMQVLSVLLERRQLAGESARLRNRITSWMGRDLVGESDSIRQLRGQILQSAGSDTNVWIQGDRGTGKQLVARLIHETSSRASGPFIKLNCAAFTAERLETALFGSQPADGQPTAPDAPGVIELADGGTLFLHNIDAMPAALQGRLVRTLERMHLGVRDQSGVRRRNVRLIAATRQDAPAMIDRAEFRADLHRHLNGSNLTLPTLSERKNDLPLLADHFVSRTARKEGRLPAKISPEALAALESHPWPGHVAELENVIERACLLNSGEVLTANDIQPWLGTETTADLGTTAGMTLGEMERKLIESTFQRFGGNREKTAKALDIGVRTLCGKLREYGYPPRGGPGSNLVVREARVA